MKTDILNKRLIWRKIELLVNSEEFKHFVHSTVVEEELERLHIRTNGGSDMVEKFTAIFVKKVTDLHQLRVVNSRGLLRFYKDGHYEPVYMVFIGEEINKIRFLLADLLNDLKQELKFNFVLDRKGDELTLVIVYSEDTPLVIQHLESCGFKKTATGFLYRDIIVRVSYVQFQ